MPAAPRPDTRRLDAEQCHDALRRRDAAQDGRFFVGVSSTGVYCRPVCRVRTPRPENCHFFELAAQAEAAGYRPCLRCRPELAPSSRHWSTQDACAILARQAAQWLDQPDTDHAAAHATDTGAAGLAQIAGRLGISDRHLRRVFEAYWGISPGQYRQTRRLLTAKQLLSDTHLPIAQIASLSGFASLRRFNDAFVTRYRLTPTALRTTQARATRAELPDHVSLRLDYRPPLDVDALLAFWQQRALVGIELIDGPRLLRTLTLHAGDGRQTRTPGWIACEFDRLAPRLRLTLSASLVPLLPVVIAQVRQAFDLDADSQAIHAVLHSFFPHGEGLRVPGAFDGFEVAVRAVLGQQVTVAAARTLAQRLVERFGGHLRPQAAGGPLPDGMPKRLFPQAAVLAHASGDALGALGIVRQRQAAIVALAHAVAHRHIVLEPMGDDPQRLRHTVRQLCDLPGVGDWTAQYIAMRVLRDADALPAGDVALHRALGLPRVRNAAPLALQATQDWAPWRSYGVVRAWHHAHHSTDTSE